MAEANDKKENTPGAARDLNQERSTSLQLAAVEANKSLG